MKKTIFFIVTLLLTFLLTSCSGKENSADSKKANKGTSQADVGSISEISEFSNGLAFVKYSGDENTYCIDKTGKQLFKLEIETPDLAFNFAKFNDKVAIIATTDRGYFICDKKGKTYTAEDFDATRIVLDTDNHKLAFLDGYIILERKEESYTGTKTEMSIMDSDLHTLVPFSAEFAEKINSESMNVKYYYDGYLYFRELYGTGAKILDLRTGKQLTDTTQMKVSKPFYSYLPKGTSGGCFGENLEYGDIYNELTGEVIAKVKEKESVSQILFYGDIGLATYDNSDNGTWFNIIDKNGESKFEPIQAGYSEIRFDGETILIIDRHQTLNAKVSLKTYDVSGNLLGEAEKENVTINFNDGVIEMYDLTKEEYLLYDPRLETLF